MKHENKCRCDYCSRTKEEIAAMEKHCMETFGYYAHLIYEACGYPNHTNIHTHGFPESFGNLDIQICLPMHQEVVSRIMKMILDEIKENNTVFKPYVNYELAAEGMPFEFIAAREDGRDVLRLLVPNKDGTYDGPGYADQLTLLDDGRYTSEDGKISIRSTWN